VNRLLARTSHLLGRSRSERGASALEYALLVSLIAVVVMAGVMMLGNGTDTTLSDVAGSLAR
jgi:pilus assembly protein Flp/PilA